ncbi:hypothetical protein Pst134EA_031916 [Puccinia striiformis f. sp. tritici]|uniref:uncharacterized protein n=1 Tax=Puccinia striiformis f. sp. tritici TaxID=168172 RepID=UPI00200770BF|nr:uncharacterized protein Pst134EA_031916 [Puccinia striiformis f. sp. tritici]KAH9444451.1 hypothetical protein Pst134EA_031916 [Puccinia striiformis f. sp. tritici]
MLETPRKRTFGSIHSPASPNSSTRQRDQDNPWFRDPSHHKIKSIRLGRTNIHPHPDLVTLISGQDHLPQTVRTARAKHSHNKEPASIHASKLNGESHHSTTQSLKEQEPTKSSATVPEDDTVEDGEIAEEEPLRSIRPPLHGGRSL